MPYKLSGTKVVKSDTGEVVKDHPTREKALAHLRALKANVEEGSPAVLGALLEGFDDAKHPRGWHGHFIASATSYVRSLSGHQKAYGSALLRHHQRVGPGGDPQIGHPDAPRGVAWRDVAPVATRFRQLESEARQKAARENMPSGPEGWNGRPGSSERADLSRQRREQRQVEIRRRATLGRAEGDAAARTRAEILAKSPGAAADLARHQSIAQGASQPPDRHGGFKIGDVVTHETGSRGAGGHGPVTFTKQPGLSTVVGLQRNGNLRLKHPGTGTTHDVHHSHAQKVSPLHPDYRGKVVQDAYAAQRAALAAEKAARARRLGEAAPGVLGALVEGFAAEAAEPFPDQDFTAGDQVRVSVGNGARAVTGKVVRPHGGPPPTHAVIAPEGGGAHVLAPVGQVKLNTPAQHAAAQKRQEREQAKQEQQQAHAKWMATKPPGVKPPGPVREGVAMLLHEFRPDEARDLAGRWRGAGRSIPKASNRKGAPKASGGMNTHYYGTADGRVLAFDAPNTMVAHRLAKAAHSGPMVHLGWASRAGGKLGLNGGGMMVQEAFGVAAPGETPAQSSARGAQDVKTAQAQLASGWNASKHPRGRGGKFGYTTGGKRAKRGQASSSRTLGVGSSGALVKSIQRHVGAKIDGKYGPQTHAAVARYQQQHGLQVDGVVGAQTLASLRGSTNARLVAPGPIKSSQATVRAHPAARKSGKPAPVKAPVRVSGGIVV